MLEIENEAITPEIFAKGIAEIFMETGSSHAFFFFQQAFGEDKGWEDVEEVCKRIIKGK